MSSQIKSKRIFVIGSSNTDMTIIAGHHPSPGETVLGDQFRMGAGGKGANQAVAAKRLGGEVEFFCKVGNDIWGQQAIRHYREEGLDISHISFSDRHSGVAMITVDANAENCIVVASGANSDICAEDIEHLEEAIAASGILLLQLETPVEAVMKAAETASHHGVYVILNPAPAVRLPHDIYRYLSLLILNETEASLMSGTQVHDEVSAGQAADILMSGGVENVIVTMGARGSLLCRKGQSPVFTPSVKVHAIDTTAAGDTFCGGICVALSEGRSLEEAVRFATAASALAVQKIGAQESMPTRADLTNVY